MTNTWVITTVRGRHEHLRRQLLALAQTDPESAHVVVAMGDDQVSQVAAENAGGRRMLVPQLDLEPGAEMPLSAARNLGAATAIAQGAELLVLLDVDVIAAPGMLTAYEQAALSHPEALLCGPVTYLAEGVAPPADPSQLVRWRAPHTARPDPAAGSVQTGGEHKLFWSLSAALTPATWRAIGGFCEDYVGYGGEDTDFAWQARAAGVDLAWVGGGDGYHQWHPVSSPPVEHLDAIVRNARVFHERWGEWPMGGWLREFERRGLLTWSADGPIVVA